MTDVQNKEDIAQSVPIQYYRLRELTDVNMHAEYSSSPTLDTIQCSFQ